MRDALIRSRLGLPPRTAWVREALRVLVFMAAGLIFGALFLLGAD